ncbi:unnamed protein product [Owenia fusiformis]|uniref:EGF-like domain-containing protein n=1 Tax=Owenia fusiformis TaxID=6347 RepID=A0A8S4P873_OWEFU|nr:unnamed protein product [Owenia fusiformis]
MACKEIFLLLLVLNWMSSNTVSGVCTGYPNGWLNTKWLFTKYSNGQNSYLEFSGSKVTKKRWGGATILERDCQDEYSDGDWFFYYEIGGSFHYCVMYYRYRDVLQEMVYGTGVNPIASAKTCTNYVGPNGTAVELTLYHKESWPDFSCSPLPQGNYYVSYTVSDSIKNQCLGSTTSVSSVRSDRIEMKTCYGGPTTSFTPYNTTLYCLMQWDNDLNRGQGDYMAIVYKEDTLEYLYCARYTISGDRIDMSIDVRAGTQSSGGPLKCSVTKDPNHYEDSTYFKHRAFDFLAVDNCNPNPCKNLATCVPTTFGYKCDCVPGFEGATCETDINECSSNPCDNGATCSDRTNKYVCECPLGYIGINCETNSEDCVEGACANGGTCIDDVDSFTCECPPGYAGPTCGEDVNECASFPCQNGALCNDLVNSYSCNCGTGYTGTYCETDVNECWSNPCINGNCTDYLNRYRCTCEPGYEGLNCDEETNECTSNPCKNGAECQDQVNSFKCKCPLGFVGTLCETEINECYSEPCFNNGTCVDYINSYECQCLEYYQGLNCEIHLTTTTILTTTFNPLCKWGQFVCESDLKCINFQRTCDCVQDCDDNSDEAYCPVNKICHTNGYHSP